ncbi:uncharacterized protein CC84DRAFT_1210248 [Paraphaeosphaeria sporulosa]|uniref:Zn(2)-C6 fungal-type domain-containing protein n=1 Tax=Paraphaeosphaeria sporulosa TaxID=1460663 RepID=A0A177BV72_9PLEO|nr:uncharacterized protein CC84DRAFT_1210248 [Paraphaeosphaeria sporulosa]OAF99373.1 hypothetical protein CC84DRAFT_1210248 [Paraphaeosphaeria sporulosa]
MVTYFNDAQPMGLSPALHRYACIRCRQRKVKCDKTLTGCANCKRYEVECIFSARRPRKKQNPHSGTALSKPGRPAPQDFSAEKNESFRAEDFGGDDSEEEEEEDEDYEDDHRVIACWSVQNQPCHWSGNAIETNQGRLITDAHGKSYFINSDKASQASYFETALGGDTDDKLPASAEQCSVSTNRCEHLDANSLLTTARGHGSLRTFYPHSNLIPKFWDHYALHVDTMFKVLFKPNVARLIHDASSGFPVDPSGESLLFAVIYAVIASSPPEECRALYGAERKQLLRKYRIALERALVQAGWMATQEIVVLQSLAIYLAFASDRSRSTWVLSGMIISLAQAMGLHTDVASSSLTAAGIEVRRRVWWSLCQIDVRVSNNCGLEPHVPLVVDCQLPLHINDADLESERDIDNITPRDEKTEMTLTLIRVEMVYTTLRFTRARYKLSPTDRETLIKDQMQRYSEVYMRYFTDCSEFSRLCAVGLRYLMARLWKHMQNVDEPVDTGDFNEHLLLYNADVLEIAQQMPERQRQYGWFFRCKCSQWHALVYLLTHLCKHNRGAAIDRAWESVNAFFTSLEQKYDLAASRFFEGTMAGKKNALWQPLLRLLDKARDLRAQSCNEGSSMPHAPGTTPDENKSAQINERSTGAPLEQEGILANPFLGQSFDFGREMNWEQVDLWAHDFQAVLTQGDGTSDGTENLRDDNLREFDWW